MVGLGEVGATAERRRCGARVKINAPSGACQRAGLRRAALNAEGQRSKAEGNPKDERRMSKEKTAATVFPSTFDLRPSDFLRTSAFSALALINRQRVPDPAHRPPTS